MRDAIIFATTLEGMNLHQIDVRDTKYPDGRVLVVGAADRRVNCVLSAAAPLTSASIALKLLIGTMNYEAHLT
ncbi:hypothetical protein SAMN05192563_105730 [Paraburkholderia aspalathi]|uniref:Uncharacterized protein n=1 Tax=Paraburkholderia aspalathi TaxID=1324617 RepID=A0A1I7ERH1_9BURK|nr:hypothetical protein SAMN05192563_105730 [Paraburkholderia aspalathi]